MQDLNWKENYTLGQHSIDEEHKHLFQIAAKAFGVVQSDQKIQKIRTIVHELIDYTKVHFAHEEVFMEKINYPKLIEHQKIHHDIIHSMNKFLKTINTKAVNEIEKDLAHFVEIWFINHIIYEDKKVHTWLHAQNISPNTMNWKSEYKIGEETIDAQHKELFDIAQEAFTQVSAEEKKEKIKDAIHKLYKYTHEHFTYEEEFMCSINYNNLQDQQVAHAKILDSLNELIKNCTSMSMGTLEDKLIEFVDIALIEHIVKEDKKISNFLAFSEDLKEAKKLKEV